MPPPLRVLPLGLLVGLLACTQAAPSDSPAAASSPSAQNGDQPTLSPRDPAPAPAAPYDLAADLAARLAGAAPFFSAPPVSHVESSVFLFIAAGHGHPFDDGIELAHRALPALFNGRFVTPPDRAVTVFLFPSAEPYDAFCVKRYGQKCATEYGEYFEDRRELVMNAATGGETTLLHELVHPIVASDAPHAPDWLDEGIATLYEVPDLSTPGEIRPGPNKRHGVLLAALRSPETAPHVTLESLFTMTRDMFYGADRGLHFAMAHDFCAWLDSMGKLWPFYRTLRDDSDRDHTGHWSFSKVMGKSVEDASADWVTWVKSSK